MRHSVVRHVDGAVRKAFNQILGVPGDPAAQAKSTRASPLVQPAEHMVELPPDIFRVQVGLTQQLPACGSSPVSLAICQVELKEIPLKTHSWLARMQSLPTGSRICHDALPQGKEEQQTGTVELISLA